LEENICFRTPKFSRNSDTPIAVISAVSREAFPALRRRWVVYSSAARAAHTRTPMRAADAGVRSASDAIP